MSVCVCVWRKGGGCWEEGEAERPITPGEICLWERGREVLSFCQCDCSLLYWGLSLCCPPLFSSVFVFLRESVRSPHAPVGTSVSVSVSL